jgi:hypothetical protein
MSTTYENISNDLLWEVTRTSLHNHHHYRKHGERGGIRDTWASNVWVILGMIC